MFRRCDKLTQVTASTFFLEEVIIYKLYLRFGRHSFLHIEPQSDISSTINFFFPFLSLPMKLESLMQ